LRRTATVDSNRPDGLDGPVVVDARARDLRTATDGIAEVIAACRLDAVVDGATRTMVGATADGDGRGWVAGLAGARTGMRYRRRLAEAAPSDLAESDPLLLLLLDDVPGSQLVAGYGLHRDPGHSMVIGVEYLGAVTDVCAGWAVDASILTEVRRAGEIPSPVGPEAPAIVDPDADPLAWHDTDPLGPHGLRRLRRLDVCPDAERPGRLGFDVHFRDSHVDHEGRETVVHEYTAAGSVSVDERRILEIEASPRVLPWLECPTAAASARRLVGRPVGGLRAEVSAELVGTSTCTHLNDLLRTLADLDGIVAGWDGDL
jgi:hypothetical protein